MPTPADPGHPRRQLEELQGRGWMVVTGVVAALVVSAVVATVAVLGFRPPDRPSAFTPASSSRSAATDEPSATASGPTESPPGPAGSVPPTAAPPTPLPTQPTTAAPGQPSAAPGPDRSLRTNSLYGVDLAQASVDCDLKVRRPKPPLADDKLEPYLNDVVDCLTEVWTRPLADRGFTLEKPKVETFHTKVKTPCGTFGQDGSPAYYCSSSRTIYWPDTVDDGREAYTFARLGYVALVAHEYGHHLQFTTGMLARYAAAYADAPKKTRYALSRRLELQAQCFEGVFLHAVRDDLHVTSTDRSELKTWHSYTGDEDPPESRKPDHGTSKAQYAWLARGLNSGDVADCNTWTAESSEVK